jgi:hypothetical protein
MSERSTYCFPHDVELFPCVYCLLTFPVLNLQFWLGAFYELNDHLLLSDRPFTFHFDDIRLFHAALAYTSHACLSCLMCARHGLALSPTRPCSLQPPQSRAEYGELPRPVVSFVFRLLYTTVYLPSIRRKRHMLDENEGANERDGCSCATTMFVYQRVHHARGKFYTVSKMGGSSGLQKKSAYSRAAGVMPSIFYATTCGIGFSVYFYDCTRRAGDADLMKIMRESKALFF